MLKKIERCIFKLSQKKKALFISILLLIIIFITCATISWKFPILANFISAVCIIAWNIFYFMFLFKEEYKKLIKYVILAVGLIFGVVGIASMIADIMNWFKCDDTTIQIFQTIVNSAVTIVSVLIGIKVTANMEKNKKNKEEARNNVQILECLKMDIHNNLECCNQESDFENIDFTIWSSYKNKIIELFLEDMSLVKNILDLYKNLEKIKSKNIKNINLSIIREYDKKICPHIQSLIEKYNSEMIKK